MESRRARHDIVVRFVVRLAATRTDGNPAVVGTEVVEFERVAGPTPVAPQRNSLMVLLRTESET